MYQTEEDEPSEVDLDGRWTAWGRGSFLEFDGLDPGVGVSGEVFNMTAGFDYETGPVLAGLALAGSVGTGDYHVAPTGVQSERMGEIWSLLGSVHPYVHVSLAEWLRVWGLGGIGSGTLRISGSEQDADLHMRMWAFGGRSDLRVPALDDLRFALPETPSARHFRRPGSGPGISRRCRIRRFAERWSGCARRGPIPQPCWPSSSWCSRPAGAVRCAAPGVRSYFPADGGHGARAVRLAGGPTVPGRLQRGDHARHRGRAVLVPPSDGRAHVSAL